MVEEGYLSLLAGDLGGLEAYWRQLLLDFPGHPAHGHEAESIPLTLYGLLLHDSPMVFPLSTKKLPRRLLPRFGIAISPQHQKLLRSLFPRYGIDQPQVMRAMHSVVVG